MKGEIQKRRIRLDSEPDRIFEPADDCTKLGSKTEISLTPNITVFPLSSTRPVWITFPIFI